MDETEEINDEGLDFDILIENVRNILEEPEFKKVLKNIGISVDAMLEEITEDMENEEGGVEPSDNEKESSYSKKCVRAKVYEKLMSKYGAQLKAEGLEENETADDTTKEMFLKDFMKAMQKGNFSKMHKAVADTGVLPVYDENGKKIYIILTPAQQKMFTKMIAENQRYMNAGIEGADLKDFDEYEEELVASDKAEIDKNEKGAPSEPEINEGPNDTLDEMQAARMEQARRIIKKQNEKNAEDKANGVLYEEKNPYIFEKDLSDIQKQRWKIEHPEDFDAQLEDSRREMGHINKLTIQTAGMTLDDIVADVEDFKARGFDVTVNLFGKVLDTRMCKDIKDVRGLVEETLHTGKSKQVAELRQEREAQVFDSETVGVDIDKIDSALALMAGENVAAQDKASDITVIAKKMEADGKELGILKTSTKENAYGEEHKNEQEDDEHQFPTMPEER